ncbi:MAG TPA: hypothetical protein VJ697_15545 [Nitrososphaeraceae archaeon]|nr:hypothetical protein [Nitrososphaeraceae archaeon]
MKLDNNVIKFVFLKHSIYKSLAGKFLILTILITGVLLSFSITSISAQQDPMLQETQMKQSVPHNALGHESHQVVQFLEPKNNTLYKGIITFSSTIPVDIIAYHDISNFSDKINKTTIKPWIIDGKTFAPTTILKNVTSGTVDFIGSGIITHIPYNQTYDVVYSINSIPFTIK